MKFRTELQLPVQDWQIDHSTPLMCLGSCFAQEIGQRLESHKFPVQVNTLGIIFHPLPLLDWLVSPAPQPEDAEALFAQEGRWYSFQLSTHWSAPDREALWSILQELRAKLHADLAQADYLILTFGTAIGFRHRELDRVVANCHKVPAKAFEASMSSYAELMDGVQSRMQALLQTYPSLKVLITVSPVRHLRSGLVENGASKAMLRVLSQELASSLPQVRYFPAYEIVMDDLRDYRFYGEDLAHPSPVAVQYIWEKFSQSYFSAATQEDLRQLQALQRDLAHRPLHPDSEAHRKFLEQIGRKIEGLAGKLDLQAERKRLDQKWAEIEERG